MIQMTFALNNGKAKELKLPLHFEELLKGQMPAYFTYGKPTARVETPNAELNAALEQYLPTEVTGGLRELNLLAYALDQMQPEPLAAFQERLPDAPCEVDEILRCACTPDGYYRLKEQHERQLKKDLDSQRMTGGQLFTKIMERARENGDLAHFDAISEYALPKDSEDHKLCSYEFDLLPSVNLGGSEGVYVDCYLKGEFDATGRNTLHIGTIKTLSEDVEACKTMGELCGVLLYHENRYMNENLYRFESPQEIQRMLTQPLTLAPPQEPQLASQQMNL